MTLREVIAEQLMLLFIASKPGADGLMMKLSAVVSKDKREQQKIGVSVPWNYELPARCDAKGNPYDAGAKGASAGKPSGA